MTLDQIITELDAAERKATQGEWNPCGAHSGCCDCGLIWSKMYDAVVVMVHGPKYESTVGDPLPSLETQKANRDFIVLARNHLRALIKAAKLNSRLVEFVKDACDVHSEQCDCVKIPYAAGAFCNCDMEKRRAALLQEAEHDA